MRRLKIGIRTQLILLVTFACLFALIILAIVCGVYFSHNLTNLRAERLEVISQLKSSQVTQSIDYLFYQVYYLTTRDTITTPLTSYRAGNNSQAVFDVAQSSLDQFVSNSESFAAARLYNLDLKIVAESFNNVTKISTPAMDYLYPLQQNVSVPNEIIDLSNHIDSFYFSGPVSNSSDVFSTYFIGITYAVYANTSILLLSPSIAGYLSVITSADNIQQAVNNNNANLSNFNTSEDYTVIAYEPVFESNDTDDTASSSNLKLVGFQSVFPVTDSSIDNNRVYPINESSAAKEALTNSFGSSTNKRDVNGNTVAIGYSRLQLDTNTYWSICISQRKSTFNAPLTKFKNIIIGVSIGIGVFVCLITFPLAVLFIRPITRLKDATDAITQSKREKEKAILDDVAPPPYYSTFMRRLHDSSTNPTLRNRGKHGTNRHSFLSAGTGGSNSQYSTGIRLPSKIPHDKSFFKDELTELTEAFNIMREELEKQYVHLEDRVKLRTKELEASKIEAEAANEAKTVFIANISHELRTPLNGILGMTSIAMEENDVGTIKDSLKLINRSGELLLHILTELLTYSKNTLNRSKLEKSSFQILEIVYQVQSIFSKLATDQRVYFKILVKPNSFRKLVLYGDSNRIIQVVMNLVSNALKFTPVEGRVDVSFKLLGEYDHQRTHQDNYETVHVMDYRNTSSEGDSKGGPEVEGASSQSSGVESAEKDAGDNLSMVTLTTQEYDNVLFQSQFLYNSKPLPEVPEMSEGPGHDTNETDYDGDSEKSPFLEAKEVPPQELPAESLSPFGDPQPFPVPANMRDSFKASSTTKLSTDSLNSHELVKNDKVYPIKPLHRPKTWVLQIEVSDTGPGIEPALQDKVFEPFIQGDQTLSRSYGGTGLGLAICRQLATMMKGTMTLKSTLGVGSTFVFTVPLPQVGEIVVSEPDMDEFCEDEFNGKARVNRKVAFSSDIAGDSSNSDAHATPPPQPVGEKPRLGKLCLNHPVTRTSTATAISAVSPATSAQGHFLLNELLHLKIMVAEDNLVNQEVIKRMLSLEGFRNVTMASNGAEAVDYVKDALDHNESFDLIFMDVQMPKIDGLLATRMIRHNLNYDRPIIALTAFADESNVKECLNSGMSGFLSKPIRRTNLRKIITEFSPLLLSDVVTPNTLGDEKRLGY